jgi:hypothetical protein
MSIAFITSIINSEKTILANQIRFLNRNPALKKNPAFLIMVSKQRQKLVELFSDLQTLKSNA